MLFHSTRQRRGLPELVPYLFLTFRRFKCNLLTGFFRQRTKVLLLAGAAERRCSHRNKKPTTGTKMSL